MLDFSIIVVNWNTCDLLMRCLDALYTHAGSVTFETIVVDNASTDNSVAEVRERYPQVHLIENTQNLGFSRANNQGMSMASGRYFLLLNSDAFVHEGALETMLEFMEEYPDTGASGCRLSYEDGSLQYSCTSFPTVETELWQALWLDRIFSRHPVFGKYRMFYWDFNDIREVDSVMGAFMLLRREAIEEVGMLDEGFFMYSEEVDLCYRMKRAGWKVRFNPQASATHIWGGTSKRIQSETTFLRLYKSRTQFFRKHYGRWTTLLYKMVLFGGSIPRVAGGMGAYWIVKNKNMRQSARNYLALMRSLRSF